MRLEKVKLAGFKSFVDPVIVIFPSNLVGVIGPNGCGKSNIIDAVRWVMGESSAKTLRGESMADVIFNGSSTRKPVGSASVELIFDNSLGKAGGKYASYAHISVKRQVGREGTSDYFLNGTKCRRKDITDIFLGTGLGPRSYSIIEQGMISRVIEARPDDLRTYFEEAAGISKYKERRRETESRIKRARENLDRLDDLIEEVDKQLRHLKRQADTAEKYKKLKAKERKLKGELIFLDWQQLIFELERAQRKQAKQDNALEAAISKQRKIEADIEAMRLAHRKASDEFNSKQGNLYAIGADTSRLEQSIQFSREEKKRQEQESKTLDLAINQLKEEQQTHEDKQQALAALQATQLPELEKAQEDEQQALNELIQAEQDYQQYQKKWEDFTQQANQPVQQAQVERTHINHIEEQDLELQRRIEHNRDEHLSLQSKDLDKGILDQEDQLQQLDHRVMDQQKLLEKTSATIVEKQKELEHIEQQRYQLQENYQQITGRLSSLSVLQQAAREEGDEGANWLGEQGLDKAKRLVQGIKVNPRWRRAVETVLAGHLQAVCVKRIDQYGELPLDLDGVLELIDSYGHKAQSSPNSLLSKIETELNLLPVLGTVQIAENLSEALLQRQSLAPGQSLITPEAVWIGSNWIRFGQRQGNQQGVLEYEDEIHQLEEQQSDLKSDLDTQQLELSKLRETIKNSEQDREEQQQEYNRLSHDLAQINAGLISKKTRAEHLKNRSEILEKEYEGLQKQIRVNQDNVSEAQEKLHDALERIQRMDDKREDLQKKREILHVRLEKASAKARNKRQYYHELALKIQAQNAEQHSLEQVLKRIAQQILETAARREALQKALAEAEQPLREQQEQLELQLNSRLEAEQALSMARSQLESLDEELRNLERDRHQSEQEVETERNSQSEMQIQCHELLVRSRALEEQLDEEGYDKEELKTSMSQQASVKTWREKVNKVDAQIKRLGLINLTAIDEFKEQSERMEYLRSQHEDVNRSLNTLKEAITKIDQETRARFKTTFDRVNEGFQELFPRLFGGGKAYLELTDDDLLNTGVIVMARPPGKRNNSIHLLSGGEKALTAIALVFAIFRLNPAPFCMLDEVDAPLDDANVGRFCNMVREMSDGVQFVIVTHNKITMEMSNQLMGVTMQESGVSRLVSVDIDEATQMVAV